MKDGREKRGIAVRRRKKQSWLRVSGLNLAPHLLFICAICGPPPLAFLAASAAEKASAPQTGLLRLPAEGRAGREAWLYVPKSYVKTRRYALVVDLHPAGLRGSHFAEAWGEVAERTGAFLVLAPECKDQKKRMWENGDEQGVVAAANRVLSEYSVDSARVLLTGFSQGAIYTYIFGLRNPTLFRAIAPVSGILAARPSPKADEILERARGVPVYICHGAADDRFPVAKAREARDRLEKLGYQVQYREEPQLGHFYPPGECGRIWAWFSALTAEPVEPKASREPGKKRDQ